MTEKRPLPDLFHSFECYREYVSTVVAIPYGKDEKEKHCINCGAVNQPEN